MTDTTSTRRHRRFWFDPRFAIGVLLVIASVGGVLVIVSSADTTTQVYAARGPIAPGDRIEARDLVTVSVRIESGGDLYLLPGDLPAEGLIAIKTVGQGELVPASAIGSAAGLRLASVVVSVSGQLAASIEPGSTAELWASSRGESNSYGPPSVIVSGATVVREIESEGIVASGDGASLELLVPRSKVARVLEAIANEDSLSVIATSLPAKG